MTEDQKWEYIVSLDEELLVGGVMMSEWSIFLIKDADLAFVHGANLACIITALAGIESHLRYENLQNDKLKLFELIDKAPIEEDLREELHYVRKYRNKWVHVGDPLDDRELLERPQEYETELENMAIRAIKALRRVIYTNQWI